MGLIPMSIIKTIIILFVILIVFTLLMNIERKPKKEKLLNERKKQSFNLQEITFVKKSVDKLNSNIEAKKRNKIETLLVQAGHDMSCGEFVFVSIVSGLMGFLIITTAFQNPLLGILFAIIGYKVPRQIVTIQKNKRIKVLERQIGSFMNMLIERYKVIGDLKQALELTVPEFENTEILYRELLKTLSETEIYTTIVALQNLAFRTGNRFLSRMIDYYEAADAVNDEKRIVLMKQAYAQWADDQSLKRLLKKEIGEPVRDALLLIGTIPVFACYQAAMDKTYVPFMLQHQVGKIGTTVIVATVILCIWLVINKINAPLD